MSESDYPDEPVEMFFDQMGHLSDNTLDNIRTVLSQFSEWSDRENLLNATGSEVRDFLKHYNEQGYANSTIRQKHMNIRTFYTAFQEGKKEKHTKLFCNPLDENPAAFATELCLDGNDNSTKADKQKYVSDNTKGVTYLNPSEVRDLMDAVPKPKIRNTLIVKMLVQTGARVGELCSLKCGDIKRDEGVVVIDDSKNNGDRPVPYQNLEPELTMWLDGGHRDRFNAADETDYLFIGQQSLLNDEPHITERWVGEMIREAAYDAGIQEEWGESVNGNTQRKVTPHALRSTYCVQVFKQTDKSVPTVMKMTGHEQLSTVQKYANVARDDAVDEMKDLGIDFGT